MVATLKIMKQHLLLNGKLDWAETWWEALGIHGDSELLHSIPTSKMASTVEALGWHGDSELLNHFVTISTMAATAVILKIFSCQLMPWSVGHGPSLIRHMSVSNFPTFLTFPLELFKMAAILKVFSCYLLPNSKSDGVETWWKALGQHGDLELLKWFRSDIQDGHHGGHLESLQITSAPEW